jgi:Phasin protein
MAQSESQSERQDKAFQANQIPVDFAETAKRRFSELADVQTELVERFQEANKRWLDRAQAEANLAVEFVSKLSSARSIPDATAACQEWGSRRFELMAEDAAHVLDDTQTLMRTSAHLLANAFGSKSLGIST